MTKYLDRRHDLEDPAFVANYDELTLWSSRFGALLLDHLELRDSDAVLRDLYRVARRGARLILTTNVRGHMKEFYALFRELLAGDSEALQRLEKNQAHRGSKEELDQRVSAAGFITTRAIETSFPFRFVNGTALFNHPLVHWFLGGWREAVKPAEEVAIFSELERRLNEKARREGEIRTTIPMLYLEAEKQT